MDFLKAYPFISMEQYMWEIPLPKLRLMMVDATKVIYLSEEQAKKYKGWNNKKKRNNETYDDADSFAAALGIPSF